MVFVNHDFYTNFLSSLKYGDQESAYDILMNELSELISRDYKKLDDLFKTTEVKTKGSSDKKYINAILDNCCENKKMVRGIAFLIAEQNDITKKFKPDVAKKKIDKIHEKINFLFIKINNQPDYKKAFKDDLIQKISYKNTLNPSRSPDSNNKRKKVIKVIVIGGLIILVTFLIVRSIRKKKAKKAEEGLKTGEIDNNMNNNENNSNNINNQEINFDGQSNQISTSATSGNSGDGTGTGETQIQS